MYWLQIGVVVLSYQLRLIRLQRHWPGLDATSSTVWSLVSTTCLSSTILEADVWIAGMSADGVHPVSAPRDPTSEFCHACIISTCKIIVFNLLNFSLIQFWFLSYLLWAISIDTNYLLISLTWKETINSSIEKPRLLNKNYRNVLLHFHLTWEVRVKVNHNNWKWIRLSQNFC